MRVHRLEDLGERVPEAEGIAGGELLMGRLAPLQEHVRDLGRRDRRAIDRADHDVVGAGVGEPFGLVGIHPFVESPEPVPELADGAGRQVPEVALCEPRVLAADPHLATEAEVVAHEDPRACYEAGWIALIVAVADANDPAEVRLPAVGQGDGEDPEVSGSVVAERVGFLKDGEPGRFELGFDLMEDRAVAERIPRPGSGRCGHVKQLTAADDFGPAMKKHASRGSLCAWCWWFDDVHRL